jgi:tRNA(fMet)-specific endonuclease VapC
MLGVHQGGPSGLAEDGSVRASQLDHGQFTPEMDLLIASTALVHGLTLVTHNTQDFTNVPGLSLADWLSA